MDRSLAIIGAGASALSFIYAYTQKFIDNAGMPDSILVFEKSGVFGPGVAYEQDLDTNLLNTKTGFITPFHDKPGDFYSWLNANEKIWKPLFARFQQQKDNYAPRPLFGLYLKSRFAWVVEIAKAKGIEVIQSQMEVVDIFPIGDGYGISTCDDATAIVRHVLLACGTIPAGRRFFGETPDTVFHGPYPLATRCKIIPKNASIAILGARLSSIDAVKGLIREGHRGPITIHSRSGYFPSVRGSQGRLTPGVFTAEGVREIAARKGVLRLEDIVALALTENAAQGGDASVAFEIPEPPANIVKYLEDEITAAEHPRLWQAILYATNSFIDIVWKDLSNSEQKRMTGQLMSAFMSYRVSFPVENAKLMLEYLKSGKVEFISGSFDTKYGSGEQTHVVTMRDGSERRYDYIIWATGSPNDARKWESPLVQKLLDRGLISAHPMGGVRVDPSSHKVIDRNGQVARSLRLVGELSKGQFFFTSALEILVNHSRRCADHFVEEVASLKIGAHPGWTVEPA